VLQEGWPLVLARLLAACSGGVALLALLRAPTPWVLGALAATMALTAAGVGALSARSTIAFIEAVECTERMFLFSPNTRPAMSIDDGGRASLLNPLWFAGAFGLGLLAGRMGDAISLGFVVETENQVGAHLDSHLQQLPAKDHASRAIVAQMRDDEIGHARQASAAGAAQLPSFVGDLMRAAAKVMTTVAQRV
jgi:hypothetical protein